MNPRRVRQLNDSPSRPDPIIYWMSRDQRVRDSWALLFAQELAREQKVPLAVVFCLVPSFLGATMRQYGFMLKGLREIEASLRKLNIPFFLLTGAPEEQLPAFLGTTGAGALVTDFDPLRIKRRWKSDVTDRITIPSYEVDAHNIVPCWVASPKQEYGAHTFRPKITRLLPEFIDEEAPAPARQQVPWSGDLLETDWEKAEASLQVDRMVPEVSWLAPGEEAGSQALQRFLDEGLERYASLRNDPSQDGQSDLSPYLHFGHLSAQRVATEVRLRKLDAHEFLDELIVRRELSDNYCYYNDNYDSPDGFPDWARKTLDDHRRDARGIIYSIEELEQARTHDDLWNASQTEMIVRGKMHGYMRMYWAKKILEWSESPEQAQQTCVYLNDRYELDGRDPNGYTGIAWSIGGVHDRPWPERPIFGKIRYMSYEGCKRKFDTAAYIERAKRML